MKKFTTFEVLIWVVVVSAIVGSIVYIAKTPSISDIECTTEYVQMNGEKDCENRMKANDAESEAIQESQMR